MFGFLNTCFLGKSFSVQIFYFAVSKLSFQSSLIEVLVHHMLLELVLCYKVDIFRVLNTLRLTDMLLVVIVTICRDLHRRLGHTDAFIHRCLMLPLWEFLQCWELVLPTLGVSPSHAGSQSLPCWEPFPRWEPLPCWETLPRWESVRPMLGVRVSHAGSQSLPAATGDVRLLPSPDHAGLPQGGVGATNVLLDQGEPQLLAGRPSHRYEDINVPRLTLNFQVTSLKGAEPWLCL